MRFLKTLRNLFYFWVIFCESTLFAQSGSLTKPDDMGIKEYDLLKSAAYQIYESSLILKTKASKTKFLSAFDQNLIATLKHSTDSLIIKTEEYQIDFKRKNVYYADKKTEEYLQKISDILKYSKSNLRIALAVLQEIEDSDE